MARMAESVIAAGSENRPLMLEKGMYDSWKTQIMLYIKGKENGEMLIDSIKNDLSQEEKLQYDSDFRAVNIILLGLPVDIYTLINHFQTAKEIWDQRRFVTTAKQARDIRIVNFDQLYAFLNTIKKDAKEVREMRQRFPEPLALLENTYNPAPSYNSQQLQYHTQPSEVYQPYQHYQANTPITQQLIQSPPLQSYAPTVV
ncbi:hypothetical protein Tco_1091444 [Tanacetum coccineum]|uniref:Integrase, catalytic region, zinc finger, CCHC-type, peptidase aspartic, catalytic n=1 Tax=Tanacetum coccineum TaxID=301880 RepID=A0ABQ5I714_9ASTR